MIRRRGAEGNLPVSLREKIEILVILGGDEEDSIRQKALRTLQSLSLEEFRAALSDGATPPSVFEFAATELAPERPELAAAMLENPALPQEQRELLKDLLTLLAEEASAGGSAPAGEEPAGGRRDTLIQKINRMSAAQKIKAALTGNQEMRIILIRDANKIVSRAVLQSPKLSDQEIESFAAMKNVTDEILRLIGMNRKFMKSYSVVLALVNNPRTPVDSSLPLLNRLNERDLKGVSINKNVPEVIRSMAQKMIRQRQEANKVKLPGKH